MKVYRTRKGIIIEENNEWYLHTAGEWDAFINYDRLYTDTKNLLASGSLKKTEQPDVDDILPPIGQQELWACGVTYLRSKIGRQEESKNAGGGDFYAKVYEAERPEVFFKSTPHRVAGPGGFVRIREDSSWNVPEPELTLMVSSSGKIIGYTIGNDMSSRSIEGENPLYLPQAKTYDGCAALGPCIFLTEDPLPAGTLIRLEISRGGSIVYSGETSLSQMKRTPGELVSYVFRECSFPSGCLIMTGTGIVPDHPFTLAHKDEIRITIGGIGTLVNTVL